MDRFSNLLQLANFPMPHGGPMMPFGMFPQGFGGGYGGQGFGSQMSGSPSFMGGPLGGGTGGPMMPNNSPIGLRPSPASGYGMNNLMLMHKLSGGSGYGGY